MVKTSDWENLLLAYSKVHNVSTAEAAVLVTVGEICRFCRRLIPDPVMLRRRLEQVLELFKLAHYDSVPLFNDKMNLLFSTEMAHVDNGCLSDPQEEAMYRQLATVNYHGNTACPLPVRATSRSECQVVTPSHKLPFVQFTYARI